MKTAERINSRPNDYVGGAGGAIDACRVLLCGGGAIRRWRTLLFLGASMWLSSGLAPGPAGVPLEREPIAPEPTPGLHVPFIPGRQAVVLQDYSAAPNRGLGPVVLQVPSEFFGRPVTPKPLLVWGLLMTVRYPQMWRWPQENECLGWCDGKLRLFVEVQTSSSGANRVQALQDAIRLYAGVSDAPVKIFQIEPPAGYTEAFRWDKIGWGLPLRYDLYLINHRADSDVPEMTVCGFGHVSPSAEHAVGQRHLEVLAVRRRWVAHQRGSYWRDSTGAGPDWDYDDYDDYGWLGFAIVDW